MGVKTAAQKELEYRVDNAKYFTNCIQASICWLLSVTDNAIP